MPLTDALLDSAEVLVKYGFALADAVHLAAAVSSNADALLTVDDRFIKRAARNADKIGCRVLNPIRFLEEIGDVVDD